MSIKTTYVRDCMTTRVHVIRADEDIFEVTNKFISLNQIGAPVVDERGRLVGVLTVTDCILAFMKEGYDPQWTGVVSDFMTTSVETVNADDTITKVAQLFLERKIRRYPVIDDNRVIGIVSRMEVLKELSKASLIIE